MTQTATSAPVWTLIDLEWAGRVFHLATVPLQIDSDDGIIEYAGTLGEAKFSEGAGLFSVDTAPDITVRCVLPVDVAELVEAGHPLGGARCTVSRWRTGDALEARREVLIGYVSRPDYGALGQELAFSVSIGLWKNTNAFPPADAQVDGRTWEEDRLNEDDMNRPYPWIIGYPGKDPESSSGWITGAQGVWCDKDRYWQKLAICGEPIEATTVMINQEADYAGVEVNLRQVKDLLGRTITIVDYGAEEYGGPLGTDGSTLPPNYLGADYCPLTDEQVSIFVGFHAGGGILGADGQVIRRAGDVVEWALSKTSLPIDYGRTAAAKPQLVDYLIDGVVDRREDEWDKWITNTLVPILPISIVQGPRGYYPLVWRWNATARDATFRMNVDREKLIQRQGSVQVENDTIRNDLAIDFGRSVRTQTFLRTSRLGVYAQEYASCAIRGADQDRAVFRAAKPGAGGEGIEISCVVTMGALTVTENVSAKTILVEFPTATYSMATIIAAVNAVATLGLLSLVDGSGGGIWIKTLGHQEQTATTALRATAGQSGSLACAVSQQRYRLPNGQPGVYPYKGESYYIYDRGTADRVLQWWAAAYAFERRTITYAVPEGDWLGLERGQVGLLTDSELHLDERVVLVGDVQVDGSGMLGVLLHLLTDPARERV